MLTLRAVLLRDAAVLARGLAAVDFARVVFARVGFEAVDLAAVVDFGFAAERVVADFGFAAARDVAAFGLAAARDLADEDFGAGIAPRLSDQELQQRLLGVAPVLGLIPDPLALSVQQSRR